MIDARESHTATLLPDGSVLIAGGHQGRQAAITIYDSAERYDPITNRFSATRNMTVRRHKHDAVLLADGQVLVTGGSDERDGREPYATAEGYDPATGRFSSVAAMPAARYKHAGTSIVLRDGRVLIAGGARQAALFDPRTMAFQAVTGSLGAAPLSRLFATATLLPTGTVLLAGGYGQGQLTSAAAWLYRP